MTRRDILPIPGYHVAVRARCQAYDAAQLNKRTGTPQRDLGHCIARVITSHPHPIARMYRGLL